MRGVSWGRQQVTWRDAAERARFAWYVPVAPAPVRAWAGGFGFTDNVAATSLQVSSICGGTPVEVETRCSDDAVGVRHLMHHAILHEAWQQLWDAEFPITITLDADDRNITVDGVATIFTGIRRMESDYWVGGAQIGHVFVTVTVRRPVNGLALASSRDASLPPLELPEDPHV